VAEANESQSGKTYRGKLLASVYNERVSLVTQKQGGVGSDDESFNEALVRGHPFASGAFGARIVRHGTFYVDPEVYFIFLSSNGVNTTRDFANRSNIIRIRKQPEGYAFRQYPEGDVLQHVRANQPYVLGCVFAVIKVWLEQGKPKTNESRHDFRDWCQPLDWIVQNILKQTPLMDGHDSARDRVSNPVLGFVRKVAVAVEKDNRLDQELTTQQINQIANEHGIDIPSFQNNGDEAAFRIIGQQMKRVFKDAEGDSIELEGYRISRGSRLERRTNGEGSFAKKIYTISRIKSTAVTAT